MEGVVDPVTRELLTAIGGIDFCVTEFVRVTSTLLPPKVFYKYCPELLNHSKTASGVPVFVQLLGSDLVTMGENAQRACELGAYGIDINFGCPAKTVNRHDGGAALLKNPDRVFKVTESVRAAVPENLPVTAKVRLGFEDKSLVKEIALAAEQGGAHWLTVHARTKVEGYKPPAHWEYIALMKSNLSIPVIANGDIWTSEDHTRCQKISGCTDTMLGRGIIAQPDLALQIKTNSRGRDFKAWHSFLLNFMEKSHNYRNPIYAVQRMKQLTKLMARTYNESKLLFDKIKRLKSYDEIYSVVDSFFLNNESRPLE